MKSPDFKGDPMKGPDLTSGELGEDPGLTHMRAFLKAQKAGDAQGMWTAFKAASAECSPDDYAPELGGGGM